LILQRHEGLAKLVLFPVGGGVSERGNNWHKYIF